MYVFVFFLFGLWGVLLGPTPQGGRAGRQGAQQEALLLDDLDDIFVLHGVGQAHPLRAVLGAGALGGEQGRGALSASALSNAKADSYYGRKAGGCTRYGIDECQRLKWGPHHWQHSPRPQTGGCPQWTDHPRIPRWKRPKSKTGQHTHPVNWDTTRSGMNALPLPNPEAMLGMTPALLLPRDSPTPART